MTPLIQRLRSQDGTAIVEFALVGTFLILLLFGIWDFGRLWDARVVTTNAAREAARYGVIYSADTDLSEAEVVAQTKQRALEYLDAEFGSHGDVLPYSESDISVLFPGGRAVGQPVQVEIAVKVELWSLIRQFFGGADSTTITGEALMRI